MKKIILAVFLALISLAPTLYAQTTKSAPDFPQVKVTLDVKNGTGGAFKATNDKDQQKLETPGTLKLIHGAVPTFALTAQKEMMLDKLTVNGVDQTDLNPKLEGTATKVTTYSKALAPLTGETKVVIAWKEKPAVVVTVAGTEQVANDQTAATVTVTADGATVSELKYYTTSACTTIATEEARKQAGTFYIPLKIAETTEKKAVDMVITMVVNNKTVPTVASDPTCSTILLQGQPLSAAVLEDGEAKDDEGIIVKGSWSWANPNQAVKAGEAAQNVYEAIFTPADASMYAGVTAKVGVAANVVTTVTIRQTEGGTVTIAGATPDNKYVGTTTAPKADLSITATPKAGYKFVKWESPADQTNAVSETGVTLIGITATDGLVVSAQFAPATRAIAFTASPSNGTLSVKNGTMEVKTGDHVAVGTTLTIAATPADGYQVGAVGYTYDGSADLKPATSFVVGGESGKSYTVKASFEAMPDTKHMINVAAMQNGTILMQAGNAVVNPNSSLEEGTSVAVIALPNHGYKLATLTAGGKDIKTVGSFAVGKTDLDVAATFAKESYPVTVATLAGATFNKQSATLEYGTKLTGVTVVSSDANKYKVVSLLVNNLPVENGSDITVEGPVSISAHIQALSPLAILNEQQTNVIYNGKAQEYAVRTAAGLGGFKVTYGDKDTAPTDVGTYTLTIARPADGIYAAFSATRTLVIEPGVPGIVAIPLLDAKGNLDESSGKATISGRWTEDKPGSDHAPITRALRAGETKTIYFVPSDKNIGWVAMETVKAGTTAYAVTVSAASNGSVVLKNGTTAVTNGKTYSGQTFTIEAIPDAGYKLGSLTVDGVSATSFTLTKDVTVAATFTVKDTPVAPTGKKVSKSYTGSAIAVTAADLGATTTTNWVITYKQANMAVVTPVNVGEYDIYVSRAEDATYRAVGEINAGTLTVGKAILNATKHVTLPVATSVLKGDALSTSMLNGGEVKADGVVVPGTFTWATADAAVDAAGSRDVTFTPTAAENYSAPTGLKTYVSLKNVPSYKMTLVVGTEGSVQVTDATGAHVVSGAMIPEGMLLSIKALSGTIEKVTASKGTLQSTTTNSVTTWTCTTAAEAFTLTVTFVGGNTPEPPAPGEDDTPATGVTLSATTKTLAIGAEFTLTATVAPADATIKTVNWTSSNPSVATVSTSGKVKALKAGTASIIATTTDGGFTALCAVTVTAPTGLDDILANTRVYAEGGTICIVPDKPLKVAIVNMLGGAVFSGQVTDLYRVPVSSGVYLVKLGNGRKESLVKVLVR